MTPFRIRIQASFGYRRYALFFNAFELSPFTQRSFRIQITQFIFWYMFAVFTCMLLQKEVLLSLFMPVLHNSNLYRFCLKSFLKFCCDGPNFYVSLLSFAVQKVQDDGSFSKIFLTKTGDER